MQVGLISLVVGSLPIAALLAFSRRSDGLCEFDDTNQTFGVMVGGTDNWTQGRALAVTPTHICMHMRSHTHTADASYVYVYA